MSARLPKRRTHALAASLCLVLFAACGPADGTRRPQTAYYETGTPRQLRFEGEEVYWQGEWRKDGEAIFYDENGKVIGQGSYELGKEGGPWVLIENGSRGEGEFKEGQRSGSWEYSFPSGKTEEEGTYMEGKRHGEWTRYYSNGVIKSITTYDKGEAQGTPKHFDKNGERL